MSFEASTHAKSWLFTQEQLNELRQQSHEKVLKTLQNPSDALSLEDQSVLRIYYEQQIQQICKHLSLPDKCQATSIAFFKRFYLSCTLMDHHPKTIMLTSIYVASKVEEHHIDLDDFCKTVKIDQASIQQPEMTLLEGLRFQLKIYHPYRALHGLMLDLQSSLQGSSIDALWVAAQEELHLAMATDLPLLYPPSQLALAALLRACSKLQINLKEYLSLRFGSQSWYDSLVAHIDTIGRILDEAMTPPSLDTLRAIDRKLRFCSNPELNPDSAQYIANKAKKEAEKEAQRQQKLQQKMAKERAEIALLTGFN